MSRTYYERVEYDPLIKRDTRIHMDADGNITWESIQDVQPIVDDKDALFNSRRRGDKWHGERGLGEHVAHLPMKIWFDLFKRGIVQDRRPNGKLAKWLNSSEGRCWKTRPGNV